MKSFFTIIILIISFTSCCTNERPTSRVVIEETMEYLCSDECRGRQSGDIGYDKAALYTASKFKEWDIKPLGDMNGNKRGYLQQFEVEYTQINEVGYFKLYKNNNTAEYNEYDYPDNFMPGGTSDTGEILEREIVYVGHGVSAPELGYDDYAGIDVNGKIVVIDLNIPYKGDDKELKKKWIPYQYHSYKMRNASDHGAAGVIYASNIANGNSKWNKGLLTVYVSNMVIDDIFEGNTKTHNELLKEISQTMRPASFNTGKKASIKANTTNYPNAKTSNVVGYIKGSDPELSDQYLVIGAHLDHVGMIPTICPGALDNASGSAVVMAVANALSDKTQQAPKYSVVFILFGAEEIGLYGSIEFVKTPPIPLDKIKFFLNLDGLGKGTGLSCWTAEKTSYLNELVAKANEETLKLPLKLGLDENEVLSRPRSDEAIFFMAGVPTLSIYTFGADYSTPYHHPGDVIDLIQYDIMDKATTVITELFSNKMNLK